MAKLEEFTRELRIENGWQCPECDGVNIKVRSNRFHVHIDGFRCDDCGCNWSKKITFGERK